MSVTRTRGLRANSTTKCLFSDMPVAGRQSSSTWSNNHAPRSDHRRSENLGILCAVPARPRLGASSSIHIPASDFTNSSIVEHASRRLDERPADRSSRSLFSCTYASSDAVTDSESVERNEECSHRNYPFSGMEGVQHSRKKRRCYQVSFVSCQLHEASISLLHCMCMHVAKALPSTIN